MANDVAHHDSAPTARPTLPFAPGSIIYKPYVCDGSAARRIDDLLEQAQAAEHAGFDGVCVSEHHLGFPGYFTNPLQAVSWILGATNHIWAAPAPMLVLLRPARLVAEELAWLAARYPRRVGAGFAAGAIAADFDLAGTDQHELATRYEQALAEVCPILSGQVPDELACDPAFALLRTHPIPVVSAASSSTACRRAARVGCGVLLESSIRSDEAARQIAAYRVAGGRGPVVLVRRAWIGSDAPVELEIARDAHVRKTVPEYRRDAWLAPEKMIVHGTVDEVAVELAAIMRETGADVLNLRAHVPGIAPAELIGQINLLGAVLPRLRSLGFPSRR
jgi:alkanesulfonate monooxygenase SsuD/methylene tetrahydromethanopterin reductase-like flavin-dependent oxidoreductase (luciferase family)